MQLIPIISELMLFNFLFYRIISFNNGVPPLTYKRFQAILSKMDPPKQPEDTITGDNIKHTKTPISDEHDDKFGVPSLEELGKYNTHICTCLYNVQFLLMSNEMNHAVNH